MSDSAYSKSALCAQFEANGAEYVEHTLPALEQQVMDAHVLQCANCNALLADLHRIVSEAGRLPVLAPSRDLWSGIAERLDTPVGSIAAVRMGATAIRTPRRISVQAFAIAAAALVMISSGATYAFITRANSVAASNNTAALSGAKPFNDTANTDVGSNAPLIAVSNQPAEVTYEHEIVAMRRIVDERLGDLDSSTVVEIERNLRIIDKAISDSRLALERDPHSRFLSTQLDRALENKLDVLRRVALL